MRKPCNKSLPNFIVWEQRTRKNGSTHLFDQGKKHTLPSYSSSNISCINCWRHSITVTLKLSFYSWDLVEREFFPFYWGADELLRCRRFAFFTIQQTKRRINLIPIEVGADQMANIAVGIRITSACMQQADIRKCQDITWNCIQTT